MAGTLSAGQLQQMHEQLKSPRLLRLDGQLEQGSSAPAPVPTTERFFFYDRFSRLSRMGHLG